MKGKANFLLYIIAGFLFFIFWLFIVFPYDALESRVITEIENQTGGRYQIAMKDMDLSLFGSVTFKDLKVTERAGGQKKVLLSTPKFKLGFSPFGVLSQKVDFTFYMKGKKKGDLEGAIKQESDETYLNVEFDEFPLSELKFLTAKAKVGLKGKLDGEIDLNLNRKNPKQNKGDINLNFENLSMDSTKINLDPSDPSTAMEIPQIKLSGSKGSGIKGKIIQDKFELSSIKLTGGDLDLDLKGSISLKGKTPADYKMALEGGFKMSDKLTKAIPFLFILDKQKGPDGVYPLSISGRIGKPNIRIGKFRLPI